MTDATISRSAAIVPPSRMPAVIWLGMTVILAIVDAFGVSAAFGAVGALAFWGALVGVNMLGWSLWRRSMPGHRGSAVRMVLGAIILNALLAIEVPLLYRMLGQADASISWKPFAYGLLATGFVMILLRAARARHVPVEQGGDPAVPFLVDATPIAVPGILARAGIDAADLLSVRAEDHYCRLAVRGRATRLIHYRFRDAVGDLAGIPGAQVHRSAWVADHAVVGSERTGRRWALRLADGSSMPVSETSVALCRTRGWLERGELA